VVFLILSIKQAARVTRRNTPSKAPITIPAIAPELGECDPEAFEVPKPVGKALEVADNVERVSIPWAAIFELAMAFEAVEAVKAVEAVVAVEMDDVDAGCEFATSANKH
jgi:hypothetical protein